MSDAEFPVTIRLSRREIDDAEYWAETCQLPTELWLSDTIRCALAERRGTISPIGMLERRIVELQRKVNELTKQMTQQGEHIAASSIAVPGR